MAKRKRTRSSITDPLFGKLKPEYGSWMTEATVEGFDEPWTIYLDGSSEDAGGDDDDPPLDAPSTTQRETFTRWVKARGARQRIQPLLLQYYKRIEGVTRAQMMPKHAAQNAPVLQRPEQIWDLVSYVSITIPHNPSQAEYDFTLRMNCTWDEEHGLEMHIRDGKPVWDC